MALCTGVEILPYISIIYMETQVMGFTALQPSMPSTTGGELMMVLQGRVPAVGITFLLMLTMTPGLLFV